MSIENERLEHTVSQILRDAPDLSSNRIEVIADDGEVTLRGTVQSARRKLSAHEIAAAHPDVSAVINDLEIGQGTIVSDVAIAFNVTVGLTNDHRVHAQTICVDVLNGNVTLTGYVSSDTEKNVASDVSLGVSGVRAVENMLINNPDAVISNSEHAATISGEIERAIGLELDNFFLSVVDETAKIGGTVDEIWKKEEVEKIVRKHQILTVANSIVVKSR